MTEEPGPLPDLCMEMAARIPWDPSPSARPLSRDHPDSLPASAAGGEWGPCHHPPLLGPLQIHPHAQPPWDCRLELRAQGSPTCASHHKAPTEGCLLGPTLWAGESQVSSAAEPGAGAAFLPATQRRAGSRGLRLVQWPITPLQAGGQGGDTPRRGATTRATGQLLYTNAPQPGCKGLPSSQHQRRVQTGAGAELRLGHKVTGLPAPALEPGSDRGGGLHPRQLQVSHQEQSPGLRDTGQRGCSWECARQAWGILRSTAGADMPWEGG